MNLNRKTRLIRDKYSYPIYIKLRFVSLPQRSVQVFQIIEREPRAKGGNSVKCGALRARPLPKGEPTDRAFPVCPIDRAKDFRLLIKIARALEFSIKRVATFPLLLSLFLIIVLFFAPRLRRPRIHFVFSSPSVGIPSVFSSLARSFCLARLMRWQH